MTRKSKHCWHDARESYGYGDRRCTQQTCCHCGTQRTRIVSTVDGQAGHGHFVQVLKSETTFEGGEGECTPPEGPSDQSA